MRRIAGVLSLIVIIVFGLISIPKINETKECKETSNNFLHYIGTGNLGAAQDYCTGTILYKIKTSKGETPEATIRLSDSKLVYIRGDVAKTTNVCGFRASNREDIRWYDLYLIKDDNKWKVYNVEERLPSMYGVELKPNNNNKEDIEEVIKRFIEGVIKGEDVSDYLAGPALKSYEQIPTGIIKGDAEELKIESVFGDTSMALYKASYKLEDRKVELLINLYKLDEWKIISIMQV